MQISFTRYRNYFAAFGFALFCSLLLFHPIGSVAFVLLEILFLAVGLFSFGSIKYFVDNTKTVAGFAAFLLVCFYTMLTSANVWTGTVLPIVSSFFAINLFDYLLILKKPFFDGVLDIISVPVEITFQYIFSGFRVLGKLMSLDKVQFSAFHGKISLKGPALTIVRGLVFSLPICFVLLAILSVADPIYANAVSNFFTNITRLFDSKTWVEIFNRFTVLVVILAILIPYVGISMTTNNSKHIARSLLDKLNYVSEWAIVTFFVALILGSFLAVQWPYVFANVAFETDLSKLGVATYSEYVRRGFGELLLASLLVYVVVWFGYLQTRKQEIASGVSKTLFYLQQFVLAEFVIFLISLFRRDYLYILYHGLSNIRIYGGLFLIYVAGLTLVLLLRFWKKFAWVKVEVILTAAFLSTLMLFNAEDFLSRFGLPTVNKRVDYIYLSSTSADGYHGWKKAFDNASLVLTSAYSNPEFVNREQRREIAYSGMIATNLLRHYGQLASNFGTLEDKKEYNTLSSSYGRVFRTYGEYNYSTLDNFLVWNFQREKVFAQMKQDMDFKTLSSLFEIFTKISDRIAKQPEGERNIDIDVSWNSPFLDVF